VRSLFRALSFLSILPFSRGMTLHADGAGGMFAAFPVAGAFLGALMGLVWHATLLALDPLLSAAITIAVWALLTRFFHLDGVADCADALWGAYTPERRLEILKDPRTGSFGVSAIALVLLLKVAALESLSHATPENVTAWTLPLWRMAGGALVLATGRWCVFPVLLRAISAREHGLGRTAIDAGNTRVARYVGMDGGSLMIVAASGAVFLPALAVLPAAALSAFALRLIFSRALGGITGDVLGAAIELGEIMALLTLAGCMRWGTGGI